MITANTDDLIKYLDEYITYYETAAENAVREYAEDTVKELIRVTPYGDSITFADWYSNRESPLPKAEGMTRANWKISVNASPESVDYISGSRQGENSLYKTYAAMQGYKLGDNFSFYNNTDYIFDINSQQAPKGVAVKAEDAIMKIYRNANLNEYMK